MKKYSKQFWKLGFILSLSIFLSMMVLGQATTTPTTPTDPGNDVDAPIDGGVSLLVAAGIGYGIKKVKDNRKKKAIEIL